MIVKLYAIRDIKNDYGQIFQWANDQIARRNLAAMQKDNSTIISKFPADFELWKLGEYDSETGVIYQDRPEPVPMEG